MLKLYEFCHKYDVNVDIYNDHGYITIRFISNKTSRRFEVRFAAWQLEKLNNPDEHENLMFKVAIDMLGLEEN